MKSRFHFKIIIFPFLFSFLFFRALLVKKPLSQNYFLLTASIWNFFFIILISFGFTKYLNQKKIFATHEPLDIKFWSSLIWAIRIQHVGVFVRLWSTSGGNLFNAASHYSHLKAFPDLMSRMFYSAFVCLCGSRFSSLALFFFRKIIFSSCFCFHFTNPQSKNIVQMYLMVFEEMKIFFTAVLLADTLLVWVGNISMFLLNTGSNEIFHDDFTLILFSTTQTRVSLSAYRENELKTLSKFLSSREECWVWVLKAPTTTFDRNQGRFSCQGLLAISNFPVLVALRLHQLLMAQWNKFSLLLLVLTTEH